MSDWIFPYAISALTWAYIWAYPGAPKRYRNRMLWLTPVYPLGVAYFFVVGVAWVFRQVPRWLRAARDNFIETWLTKEEK